MINLQLKHMCQQCNTKHTPRVLDVTNSVLDIKVVGEPTVIK